MDVVVRAARPADPVAELLFLSAAPYYAAFAGGAGHARRAAAPGSTRGAGTPRAGRCAASRVVDGAVAGVLAAFPPTTATSSRAASCA